MSWGGLWGAEAWHLVVQAFQEQPKTLALGLEKLVSTTNGTYRPKDEILESKVTSYV